MDLLKSVKLTVWKAVRERIAVVKFRMDNGSVQSSEVVKAKP